ncbi:hypothetical protein ANO11243_048090 [Dothideomycetidae sp. 11243]|nr:hypothetical protein ANO11243_048090 [fungal sp. No.11243]
MRLSGLLEYRLVQTSAATHMNVINGILASGHDLIWGFDEAPVSSVERGTKSASTALTLEPATHGTLATTGRGVVHAAWQRMHKIYCDCDGDCKCDQSVRIKGKSGSEWQDDGCDYINRQAESLDSGHASRTRSCGHGRSDCQRELPAPERHRPCVISSTGCKSIRKLDVHPPVVADAGAACQASKPHIEAGYKCGSAIVGVVLKVILRGATSYECGVEFLRVHSSGKAAFCWE